MNLKFDTVWAQYQHKIALNLQCLNNLELQAKVQDISSLHIASEDRHLSKTQDQEDLVCVKTSIDVLLKVQIRMPLKESTA